PHAHCLTRDPRTTQLHTLSLHDALPIYRARPSVRHRCAQECLLLPRRFRTRRQERSAPSIRDPPGTCPPDRPRRHAWVDTSERRSEEHTSELQSRGHLVCRLLLEKKK